MRHATIIWDLDDNPTGNVQHIQEHGLTKEEVEDVLCNSTNPTTVSHTSGNPVTFGWTFTGLYIIVVWEEANDDPLMIYPLTAYEVSPPKDMRS